VVAAKVLLIDGPLAGEIVTYGHPLPQTLVVADRSQGIRWHDYTQSVRDHHYRHSDRCPCTHARTRPIDLDGER
jgi:hypothetical protein